MGVGPYPEILKLDKNFRQEVFKFHTKLLFFISIRSETITRQLDYITAYSKCIKKRIVIFILKSFQ